MRDELNNIQVVDLGVLTLSGTTPAASAWVDRRGFDSVTFMLLTNTVTAAGTAGFSAVVQESDATAGSGAAAVAADELIGAIAPVTLDAADNVIAGLVGYNGSKRYARLNVTGTASTNAGARVIAILSNAHSAPPTLIGTSVAAT